MTKPEFIVSTLLESAFDSWDPEANMGEQQDMREQARQKAPADAAVALANAPDYFIEAYLEGKACTHFLPRTSPPNNRMWPRPHSCGTQWTDQRYVGALATHDSKLYAAVYSISNVGSTRFETDAEWGTTWHGDIRYKYCEYKRLTALAVYSHYVAKGGHDDLNLFPNERDRIEAATLCERDMLRSAGGENSLKLSVCP